MNKRVRLLGCGLLLALLMGCATAPMQYPALVAADGTAPAAIELSAVPFHPQDAYQCGPAALATLMNQVGLGVSPEQLTPQVYLPGRRGSLQAELLAASRRHGLVAYVHQPKLSHLFDELRAGHPVLVLQNLGLARAPVWHYAVLVGFDLDAQQVILRSGTVEREVVSLRRFERSWHLAGRWALTLHPPGELPARAEEARYLAAVASLERVRGWQEAEVGYAAAAARWPDSFGALIGLGNARYRAGDYSTAEQQYRTALARHPDQPAAYHNLAWALLRQDRAEEARPFAERAAELGGSDRPHYHGALRALAE